MARSHLHCPSMIPLLIPTNKDPYMVTDVRIQTSCSTCMADIGCPHRNSPQLELLEESGVTSIQEGVRAVRRSWKRETRSGVRTHGVEQVALPSILGKRDGEREIQVEGGSVPHVEKRMKETETSNMEVGSTNALSAEDGVEQLHRAQ